mmetsp:Transcript_11726/g.16250  ORF Transcript_11726/g.16250 Transcript_11726/m.16250 type:complete len:178 (-) Transcript_11726:123-656(-)
MTSSSLSLPKGKPMILSFIGLVLSIYSVYVEHMVHVKNEMEDEEEFVALCDIEKIGASCSAVFTLPEGKMLSFFGIVPKDSPLDVPNAVLGSIFYSLILLLESTSLSIQFLPFVLLMNCAAMASSIFLAYKLTVLKELCLVCWTCHALNTTLLYHYFYWNGYSKRVLSSSSKGTKQN